MSDSTTTSGTVANFAHRVCPTTGLKVDKNADRLIKANAVAATVALLVGGIAAILVLLTRWQAVHLLDAAMFYRVLTIHGMNMLIFFIIFFEMAILYFAGPVLLNSRVPAPKLGWAAFVLMVTGTLMVEWTMFTGRADVLFTSYVPLRAHPAFYLGVILFAVGAIIVTAVFFALMRPSTPRNGWCEPPMAAISCRSAIMVWGVAQTITPRTRTMSRYLV